MTASSTAILLPKTQNFLILNDVFLRKSPNIWNNLFIFVDILY